MTVDECKMHFILLKDDSEIVMRWIYYKISSQDEKVFIEYKWYDLDMT